MRSGQSNIPDLLKRSAFLSRSGIGMGAAALASLLNGNLAQASPRPEEESKNSSQKVAVAGGTPDRD